MKRILSITSLLLMLFCLAANAQVPTDTAALRAKINTDIAANGSKQITALKLNQILTGILNMMKPNAVDSGYVSGDTLILVRRGYSNFKLVIPTGTGGTEADPTVPSAVKAISTFNISNWNNKQDQLSQGSGLLISGNNISAKKDSALWNGNKLQGNSVSALAPTTGQVLKWNGTTWAPANDSLGSGGGYTPPGDNTKILDGTGAAIAPSKSLVGLNLVDNTPDASKPVSTAQAAAIATKLNTSAVFTRSAHDSAENAGTTKYTDQAIQRLRDSVTRMSVAFRVNSKWFHITGVDTLDFNSDSLPTTSTGGGPIVWVANYDSVKAQRPANGTIYYTADRRASYQFVSASTATADDRSILMPTVGSGAGRWVILPQDGIVKTSQLNILPGATDWTSVLYTATKNIALSGGTVFFNLPGTYYITPAVTGGVQADFDNFKWDGIGAQYVRVLATTYTGMNKTMIGATNATPKKGFSVKNITVDLGETYASHAFAGGSRNTDTSSRAFYLDGFDSAYIGNVVIRGGTAAGIDIRKITNSLFDRIYGDSIGGNFFTNQYDTACHHITIAHSRSDYYGVRWPWDAGAGKRRNGADFWQGHSGTRGYIKLLYDTAVNGTGNAWEFEEGLGAGYGNEIAYCYLDGRGRNCMGMSPGGDGYDNITGGGVMQFNADIHHNKQVNIGPVVFSAADSATHFSPNLIEASVMNGTQFHDNIWMNNHIISGNTTKNVRFTNDIFLNDSGPKGLQGESILIEVGLSNLGTTDSSDIALDKCTVRMRGGELVRSDGSTVVKFAGVINSDVKWSGDMIGTEANLGFGSARPFISFKGSTFNGKSAGTWVYTNNTGAAININADSTDLRLSDVDFSNINNNGHTSPVISTTGSLANLLTVSGSTLQQVVGPPGAPSFKNLLTLPSGGVSAATLKDSVKTVLKSFSIPARLEFVQSGNSATYTDANLIGASIMGLTIEGYPVGFSSRSSVYMSFNPTTGTITLTNGNFTNNDEVIIIYRAPPVFLLDGSGYPVKDSNGNYIILN